MKYAYVIIGQDVFGLGDTVELALADAERCVEGGLVEARELLADGRAVIVPVSEARRYCRLGGSSVLYRLGL